MALRTLKIRGAREHNLKGIDLEIPRDSLVTFTGVSGSGKSSLVFDTIFQEGQRRFLESLSAYARQFLGKMHRPAVDGIEGLSPTVAIDQKTTGRSRRSTVGTMTGLLDLLRLLLARLGEPHCPHCGTRIQALSSQAMVELLLARAAARQAGGRPPLLHVLAPVVVGRKGEHRALLGSLRGRGYVRARIDGELCRLDEPIALARYQAHTLEAVQDRLRPGPDQASRLAEAVEGALALSEGLLVAAWEDGTSETLSARASCPAGHGALPELEPRLFSFNSPHGACPRCRGLGEVDTFTEESLLRDPNLSLAEGALRCTTQYGSLGCRGLRPADFSVLAERHGFSLEVPWKELAPRHRRLILEGAEGEERELGRPFQGVAAWLESCLRRGKNFSLGRLKVPLPCPECQGARLRPEALAVTFRGRNLPGLLGMTVAEAAAWFASLELSGQEARIGRDLLRELGHRLEFLIGVGVPYLQLDRRASTLSGGEAQRLRIAGQLGSGLCGVTYVLDEPSIGLHARDQERLVRSLERLRDLGNTVLVVEHDENTMRASDWLVDIGPGPGREGGRVVAQGPPELVAEAADSPTGRYLSGRERIPVPQRRRAGPGPALVLAGPSLHNLKGMDVTFPLGRMIVVTGVSGSGKSSLVHGTLRPALARALSGGRELPGPHRGLAGAEHLDRMIVIDAAPIGRTPRSNPATYTGAFTPIRNLFAATSEARMRGYDPGRFSFNVEGGRCKACQGAGVIGLEMHFLPDVEVPCEECAGRRFGPETLEILYKGFRINDVLDMEAARALEVFAEIPAAARPLQALVDVGLGYLRLGQTSTTLSGGEAQRVKLAAELAGGGTGKTLYLLDEPTTGLHFADVRILLAALDRLVQAGNTVLVIEHNLEVIRAADHVIDLGPEGGELGGHVVATGSPEELAGCPASATGRALAGHAAVGTRRAARPEGSEPGAPGRLLVRGARQNNLQSIDLDLPLQKLITITGLSGSGKSSLAFETLFSEGQRRFVESLSTYARRFLGRLEPAAVDRIEGLGPAIAVGRSSGSRNPRSTVATVTEIHDYLRLLYARVGRARCPEHGLELRLSTPAAMAREALAALPAAAALVAAPAPAVQGGSREELRQRWLGQGFARALAEGREIPLDAGPLPSDGELALVVDRIRLLPRNQKRLAEACEQAAALAGGRVLLLAAEAGRLAFTTARACPECGFSLPPQLHPRFFSFNSPEGACPACTGLGVKLACDPDRLIGAPDKPLLEGAFTHPGLRRLLRGGGWMRGWLDRALGEAGLDPNRPFQEWPAADRAWILTGAGVSARRTGRRAKWPGIAGLVDLALARAAGTEEPEEGEGDLAGLLTSRPCSECGGTRLRPAPRLVEVGGRTLPDLLALEAAHALELLQRMRLSEHDRRIAAEVLQEIRGRLGFLIEVGLGYLALDRPMATLSGGEAQRIRLATQLGSRLTGVLYVLDEPTVGLHPRDGAKLLATLRGLCGLGNTLVVVEHDEAFIRAADHLVDLGPGAGRMGGRVVASGSVSEVAACPESITGRYLRGESSLEIPARRREGRGGMLLLAGVRTHNLKGIDVAFPLGTLTVVSGVSGSGKSSLVLESLLPALRGEPIAGRLAGRELVRHLRVVDAAPIGSTPASTPATFTGIFGPIRELFAATELARMKGYTARRFSMNVPGGRCEACSGRGHLKIEMHFLPDVWVPCEACHGRRFDAETLAATLGGRNISEVLEMEVAEAAEHFRGHRKIHEVLSLLAEVGLGYLRLGQPAHTLSGGEAQRLRLAAELAGPAGPGVLYLLDEPTTGLHLEDVRRLLGVLHRLVDRGATVIVVEHHPGVVLSADWVLDLGPGAAGEGGQVVVAGTPEAVADCPDSWTGAYLAPLLRRTAACQGG